MTTATLKAGDVFGELIFLQMNKGQHTASFLADGPVVVGVLDMKLLDQAYRSVSPLMKEFVSTLAKRTTEATNKLVSVYLK